MNKKSAAIFIVPFFVLCILLNIGFAQGDGIPLQTDVYLGTPIYSAEDLPEQITFNIYDAQNALVPLGSQTFNRGQYAVDFEFQKSDGVSSGEVARVKAEFTQKLNLSDDYGETLKPKELWAGLEINGVEIGSRTKVSDEIMVQLLLASDASMATYLTVAYEGDDNPLTTIYKTLPLTSGTSASHYVTSLFSEVHSTVDAVVQSTSDPYWEFNSTNNKLFYTDGYVGIGTSNPLQMLDVAGHIFSLKSTGGGVLVGEGLGPNEYGGYVWDGTNNILQFATASANIITFGHYNGTVERMRIDAAGSVGIGTATPTYTLSVNGSIGCKELTVTSSGWADFVFKDNYRLPSLQEVELFISRNKHLPGIPSEAEVEENGVSVGDMSKKLLQKIEELTLYVIDLKKENDSLKAQIATIKERLSKAHR